jgi:carbon-monoxide dehydrogenase medium subunit
MKPAAFAYSRPDTHEEVLDLLHEYGDEAKVIAGGQSLLPAMSLRMARPSRLVDVNGLRQHASITPSDEQLLIGALARHVAVERLELGGQWAALSDAASQVGHYPIRVRGTFGGSISHAEPTAEFPLTAVTLGATMIAESRTGAREIPVDAFFKGVLTTDLAPDEFLTGVRYPSPPAHAVTALEEFSERSGDFALASVCVGVAFGAEGTIEWARVGVGAVGPIPLRVPTAEEALMDTPADEAAIAGAVDAVQAEIAPRDALQGSGAFRRELVTALLERALESTARTARQRASGD